MPEEDIKKRFEDRFIEEVLIDPSQPNILSQEWKEKPYEVWQFIKEEIEKAVINARMEQDIINHKAFLDKQDEIIEKAKIDAKKELLYQILYTEGGKLETFIESELNKLKEKI